VPNESEIIDFLKKYGALKPGESPWPTYNPNNEERYPVDWETLFPRLRGRRQIEEQRIWDVQDDRWYPEWDREFLDTLEEDLNREEPTDDELAEVGETLLWDVYVVSENGTKQALEKVDTLKAMLLPDASIIVLSCC